MRPLVPLPDCQAQTVSRTWAAPGSPGGRRVHFPRTDDSQFGSLFKGSSNRVFQLFGLRQALWSLWCGPVLCGFVFLKQESSDEELMAESSMVPCDSQWPAAGAARWCKEQSKHKRKKGKAWRKFLTFFDQSACLIWSKVARLAHLAVPTFETFVETSFWRRKLARQKLQTLLQGSVAIWRSQRHRPGSSDIKWHLPTISHLLVPALAVCYKFLFEKPVPQRWLGFVDVEGVSVLFVLLNRVGE